MAVSGCWSAMVAADPQPRPAGIASMAISAVDVGALGPQRRGCSELPLVDPARDASAMQRPVYGSGGFTSYSIGQLQRAAWRLGRRGHSEGEDEESARNPADDRRRVRAAREAIGPRPSSSSTPTAPTRRKQALAHGRAVRRGWACTWFEEPVSSDDLEGLRLIRDRAPAGHGHRGGRVWLRPVLFPPDARGGRGRRPPGRRDAAAAGSPGFLRVGGPLRGASACRSRPTAPRRCTSTPACALPNFRHLEYFHDHDRIEHMLFDGAPVPAGGVLQARPVAARAWDRIQATGRRPLRRLSDAIDDKDDDHDDRDQRRSSGTAPRPKGPLFVDAAALEAELRGAIRGEVRFDAGSRALYATDGSNYRQVPIGVVIPEHVDDVIATVAVCRAHGAPILSRGGGTSLTGGCCNVAVVMDWSKHLNHVLCDRPRRSWRASSPGRSSTTSAREAEKHGLTFAPDPSTHHAQHPRRDDRQQLVRRAFAAWAWERGGPPTRSTSWRSCSTTAPG